VNDVCISLFRKKQEDKIARYYMAECLRVITVNTSATHGGMSVSKKLSDIIEPAAAKGEEKNAEDIICGLKKKLNGDIGGKEENA
jgi:hypothetical protein